MTERWLPISGYEGLYEVSSLGRVKSLARMRKSAYGSTCPVTEKIRKLFPAGAGYRAVGLSKNNKVKYRYIHQLVLEAFVGPCPNGMEACHNNGNKLDNRLENLRWDTHQSNCEERIEHGAQPCGENNKSAKLTTARVNKIRRLHKSKIFTQRKLAELFGVSASTISLIVLGRIWRYCC